MLVRNVLTRVVFEVDGVERFGVREGYPKRDRELSEEDAEIQRASGRHARGTLWARLPDEPRWVPIEKVGAESPTPS